MRSEEELFKVVRLVKEAIEIGNSYIDKEKSVGFDGNYPNIVLKENMPDFLYIETKNIEKGTKDVFHPRIKEIGKELSEIGGLELMQQAYYEIKKHFGKYGSILKYVWDGVGPWRP